jgi:hypothetical protein
LACRLKHCWHCLPKALKVLIYSLAVLGVLFTVLLSFALDNSPLLKIDHGFNREDIERAKQILRVTPEEREQIKTLNLNQNDINVAASYLLNHFVENTVRIIIEEDRVLIQIAVFVPQTFWGRYLDFSFKILQKDDGFKIKSLKIGRISIPDPAANYLAKAAIQSPPLRQYWQLANQYVKSVNISPGHVEISYLAAMVDEAKQLVMQKHRDYPHLHQYQQQINAIVTQHDPSWRLSLTDLLQPLFATAYQRSTPDTAIQENRAVIIAVASYIYKYDLRGYLPLGLIYNKEYPVFAYKRVDIPQHFIASALLVAVNAAVLAEKVGEDKELGDADHGSGFSFIDLAADRSGSQFGKLATFNPEQARQLQARMAAIKHYSDVIPEVLDLPEHMNDAEFKSRFQHPGSQEYQRMLEEIDRRIGNLPLYRPD